MILTENFYNIKCDICGALVDEESWQGDIQFVRESAEDWKQLEDGRHICPACHTHEDDDSLTLKTGEVIPVDNWFGL